MTILEDCGLIAGRTQARSVYYRLTQPHGLTTLLRAAEQLLAAVGQPAPHGQKHQVGGDRLGVN
jgi:hypothetical protein